MVVFGLVRTSSFLKGSLISDTIFSNRISMFFVKCVIKRKVLFRPGVLRSAFFGHLKLSMTLSQFLVSLMCKSPLKWRYGT